MNKILKLEILEKFSSLITTGFGLVAALAWNQVIKDFIDSILPKPSMLMGELIYAVIITVLVVLFTFNLGRIINKLKETIEKEKHE